MKDLLNNNGEDGKLLWVMIHSKIYDLTTFKHPGGRDVLENDDESHYTDKGREFDSVGHPPQAIKEMKDYLIGELDENEPKTITKPKEAGGKEDSAEGEGGISYVAIFFVLAAIALIAAFALGKI